MSNATLGLTVTTTVMSSSVVYTERSTNLESSDTRKIGYLPPAYADSHWYFRFTDPFLNKNNYTTYYTNVT